MRSVYFKDSRIRTYVVPEQGWIKSKSFQFMLKEGVRKQEWGGGGKKRREARGEKKVCVLPSGRLRIVCATNKPPGRPCRAAQSITLICSGGRRKGKGGRRWRGGCGGGGAPLLSSVYKPDRWSGALTRTIKQKTTGCSFCFFFFSFLLKQNPAASHFVITRSSVAEGHDKVTREGWWIKERRQED